MNLLRIPINQDLTLKVTASGVTWLRDGRFGCRYTGSKQCFIDPAGNAWLSLSEYKKFQQFIGKYEPVGAIDGPGWYDAYIAAFYKLGGENCQLLDKKRAASENKPLRKGYEITSDVKTEDTNISITTKKISKEKSYSVKKSVVRQRLLTYLNTQQGKKELYFWTVTFPAGTTDDQAYKAFNIWLTSLRQYKMLKDYLWIAERQDGKRLQDPGKAPTNTVHFHIAIPHKMSVKRANAMMAGTLKNMARKGEIIASVDLCRRYNGVDIAKNRKTKRVTNFALKKGSRALTTYLTKYITKNDGSFTHLAWHNSRGFSSLFTGITFSVPEFQKYDLVKYLDKNKAYDGQYFVFVPWGRHGPPAALMQHLFNVNSFIQSQLN